LRDSKRPDAELPLSHAAWAALLAQVKSGETDVPGEGRQPR
jgi:Domain of unknown function (DUF397)